MSKAAAADFSEPALSRRDAQYKKQVEYYLAESNKILKRLAAERKREARKHRDRPNILEEVRKMLGRK